jgi:Sulfotransferase domain
MQRDPARPDHRPDFFIVGAFKSGTTALYDYLGQHPQVFMPFHKEPLFFGDDLTRRYGRMTREQYLSLFADAGDGQRIGEASAWYLYSRCAAGEIRDFAPAAQIIVMLRNPVDVMHAQHSQLLFNAAEDIPDFAEALAAEPARRHGERLPPGPIRRETLYYRESVRFAEQLERYFDAFGRERVHVILYDDFRDQTRQTYAATLSFLGVDQSFEPRVEVVNANRRVRSTVLQRLIFQPPRPMLGMVRALRRFPLVHRTRAMLLRMNSRAQRRTAMDPQLRAQLTEEFAPEVQRLASLIDRDLSAWMPSGGR